MFKIRRGQGAIIGGAFLVLMIITSYALYASFTRSQVAFDKTVSSMRMKDIEKGEEDIDFVYWLIDDQDNLDLYMLNSGSLTAHVLYIIELANLDKTNLTNNNIYISPGKYFKLEDFFSNHSLNFEEGSMLQLVTERGNSYDFEYTTKIPYYPLEELSGALENMSETLGDFVVDYLSFQWSEMNGGPYSWHDSWVVPMGTDVVFRLNVTFLGSHPPNPELAENTHIYFWTASASFIRKFFIVKNSGTYENPIFQAYKGSIPEFPYNKSKALYFASARAGKLDKEQFSKQSTYTGFLIIYDDGRGYSQAYPIIGIIVR